MSIPDGWIEFADDLELYLQGRLDAQEVRLKYGAEVIRDDIRRIMCNVEHFLSDSDIRNRDSRYKKMQETEMLELISLLRAGRDINDILKISFLGSSEGS